MTARIVSPVQWLDDLTAFDYDPRTRTLFGPGVCARVGELARELPARTVMLFTDPGVVAAGHVRRCALSLEQAGCQVVVFSDVQPNPTTDDVDRGLAVARQHPIDLFVALGGGSAMDCAKGVNFLLSCGGVMQDYWGQGKATGPMLPLFAIPTTAGTGSEAQSYALIADATTHVKMACGDKRAAPRIALLDPELTVSMPAGVTAATGLDAITHAVESFVCTRRNPVSQLFSRRAWRLLSQGLPGVMANPSDIEARGRMLLGAHLAGAAIENSMLGAAHALANPLTARFGVIHGYAVAAMIPHVVRYNQSVVGPLYGQLAEESGLADANNPDAPLRLADWLSQSATAANCPMTLTHYGITAQDLPTLAQEAARQWTGTFNPRPVDAHSLQELYQCALS